MKLDKRTIQVLKNFSGINSNIAVQPGNKLRTVTIGKTILAEATLEQEFPVKFAIYDLSRFLSVYSLFDEPDLDFKENFVTIKSGRKKINYVYADPNALVLPQNKEIKFPESDITFDLTAENLSDITKAMGVLKTPEVAVVGDGKNILLQTLNSKDPTADVYSIEVGETDKTFSFYFKAENIRMISDDYTVDLSMKGISRFKSKDLNYYIAIEANSKAS